MKTRALLITLLAAAVAAPSLALAQSDDRGGRQDRPERPARPERMERPNVPQARPETSAPQARPDRPTAPPPRVDRPTPPRNDFGRDRDRDRDRWYDGAHGHNHYYPAPGRIVAPPPRPPAPVWWGGVGYRYWDGVWATPGARGWVTVRPPIGIVIHDLPSWRTALVIGGLTYFYVNGIYYRPLVGSDGYEVVAAPVAQPDVVTTAPDKTFVYPRQGQSAQQQASDEYECHRWAVSQSGFDPTGAATGQGSLTVSTAARSDYQRARAACLEGRGYTVR
ncbi:MAG: hypothetical protein LCI02_29205 [Proteobacteria bacterium]|nr:hypothetical protein [Pseudomonadota bacterium]